MDYVFKRRKCSNAFSLVGFSPASVVHVFDDVDGVSVSHTVVSNVELEQRNPQPAPSNMDLQHLVDAGVQLREVPVSHMLDSDISAESDAALENNFLDLKNRVENNSESSKPE